MWFVSSEDGAALRADRSAAIPHTHTLYCDLLRITALSVTERTPVLVLNLRAAWCDSGEDLRTSTFSPKIRSTVT